MGRNVTRRYLQFIILVIVLGLGGWYIIANWHDLVRMGNVKPEIILLLFILHLLFMYVNGLVFRTLLQPLNIHLHPLEYFGLTVTTNFGSYMAPGRLGVATKVVYLKQRFGLPYAKFATYFLAQSIFLVGTGALGGLVVTATVSSGREGLALKLYIIFIALLVPLVILLALRPRIPQTDNRVFRQVKVALDGWEAIRSDPMLIVRMVLLNLLSLVVLAISVQVLFAAVDRQSSFEAAFLVAVLGTLSGYINLTPANLGIQEAIFAFLAQALGFGFDAGILAAGLNRVVQIVIVFSLAPVFSYLLTKRIVAEREIDDQ